MRQLSAQTFSQARRGSSWTLFAQTKEHLLMLARPLIDAHRSNGLRVLAGDGSRASVQPRGADLQTGHYAFALYLPGSELSLHASLHATDGSESQILFEALDVVPPQRDLLVLDRGYPGNALAADLTQTKRHFCWRVDATGWTCVCQFLHCHQAEAIVTLAHPARPMPQPAVRWRARPRAYA